MSGSPQILTPELGEVPQLPGVSLAPHDWRDGLLVRSSNWLGDAVMGLPALLQLKIALPKDCGLFVACPTPLAPLFKALEIVDLVLPLRDPHSFPAPSEMGSLRRLQAGVGILFNNSFRDALSLKLCGVPKLFGAAARFRSPLLSASFRFPKRRDRVLNLPHHAAKYLAMAYALGAPKWQGTFPAMIPHIEPEIVSPETHKAMKSPKLMAVAAGAAYGDAKRWPSANFRQVCAWWIESGGTVAALGSGGEREMAAEALMGLPEEKSFNLAGRTKIEELMLILKKSELCLANDSGVMHLAAALGVKGVAPFGSTDPLATSPVSKDWRLIFDKADCAPCFKRVCPKGTKECFDSISPGLAIKAIRELLNDGAPPHSNANGLRA